MISEEIFFCGPKNRERMTEAITKYLIVSNVKNQILRTN